MVAILIAVRVLAIVLLLGSGVEDRHSILGGDARRYEAILSSDGTPYRDFEVEYPPVTLELIRGLALGLHTGQPDANGEMDGNLALLARLAVVQLGVELGIAGLLGWAWNRRTAIAYLLLGTPFIFFPFPYVRIDLFAVFLSVLGLALVRRHRDRGGGATLAVAVLAKIWPIVLVPLVIVRERRHALLSFVVTGAVGGALWLLVFGPAGFAQVVTFRGSKGWQIESVPGIFLHMADPRASHVEGGAWRTGAHVPLLAKPLLPALALGNAGLAWWWARARHQERPDEDEWAAWALAPLAATLGLLVFSTIISPQYLLWFVPFVAILGARGERLLTVIYLLAAVLTTFELATIHGQIEGQLYATLPIVARNACLVVMLAVAMYRLSPWSRADERAGATAQSQSL